MYQTRVWNINKKVLLRRQSIRGNLLFQILNMMTARLVQMLVQCETQCISSHPQKPVSHLLGSQTNTTGPSQYLSSTLFFLKTKSWVSICSLKGEITSNKNKTVENSFDLHCIITKYFTSFLLQFPSPIQYGQYQDKVKLIQTQINGQATV